MFILDAYVPQLYVSCSSSPTTTGSYSLIHDDRQIHIRVNGTKDVVGASSSEWPN